MGPDIIGNLLHPLRFLYDLRNNIDDSVTVVSTIGAYHILKKAMAAGSSASRGSSRLFR